MVRTGIAAVVLVLAGPVVLAAQENAPPTVLAVSQYVCPNSAIQGIVEDYEANTLPVERELVAEGMLMSAGMYFHAWADEWNVNYYRMGPGIEGVLAAVAEVGARINARNPELADGRNPFEACTAHKDNFYFMGPTTADPPNGG